MTAILQGNANSILNRVAAEVGIKPVIDPYSSADNSFEQMTYLLNICGEELSQSFPWESLAKQWEFVTVIGDDGKYTLPADWLYITNQTAWNNEESVPLFGPLSAQDWSYLLGRDLVDVTIYPSWRIWDGEFQIFPAQNQNTNVRLEYTSRNWVIDSANPSMHKDSCQVGADIPMFDRTLISRMLKMKFLEAKGFDTTKAQADFNQIYDALTGHDKGAGVLSAGGGLGGIPYLNGWRNVGDTNYGM